MSDNQNIAGSAYRQTKGTMEPEKDRQPQETASTAQDIVSALGHTCRMWGGPKSWGFIGSRLQL